MTERGENGVSGNAVRGDGAQETANTTGENHPATGADRAATGHGAGEKNAAGKSGAADGGRAAGLGDRQYRELRDLSSSLEGLVQMANWQVVLLKDAKSRIDELAQGD